MMDWEEVGKPLLNWQTRRKLKRLNRDMAMHMDLLEKTPKSAIKPISGTFICPRPPDYEGIRAVAWSEEDWVTEFKRLQGLGVDTAILQSTVLEDSEGHLSIYYPISEYTLNLLSSVTKRMKASPVLETHVLDRILNAAQKTGMKIHVGLFFAITGWFGVSSAELVEQIQRENIAVAKDLLRLYKNHPSLAGWYISPEIIYPLHGKKLHLDMHSFLRGITEILKRGTPNLPIGISPGSDLPRDENDPVIDFWVRTLTDSGVDNLYPQDAMGQLVNFPPTVRKLWAHWQRIAQKTGLLLWANVELFERRSFNKPNPFEAAYFQRILWQLAACSPYVEKVVSWECMFFLNARGAAGGDVLEKEYRQYFLK